METLRHIDVPQYSDAWWEARRDNARIPGSLAAAFTEEGHPYNTRKQAIRSIVRAYHGAESEFAGNVATEWGNKHEQQALDWFVFDTGIGVAKCGIFHYCDYLGSSPDGLIGDDGVLEIKAPYGMRERSPSEFKSLHDQPHYKVQVALEMLCTGSKFAKFVQWCPQGGVVEHIERDENYLKWLIPQLKDAHREILAELGNKDHLIQLVNEVDDPDWIDMAYEYRALSLTIKKQQERQNEIKSALVDMADGRICQGGGVRVTPAERKGSIDYKKAIETSGVEIDVEQFRKPSTTYWTLRENESA